MGLLDDHVLVPVNRKHLLSGRGLHFARTSGSSPAFAALSAPTPSVRRAGRYSATTRDPLSVPKHIHVGRPGIAKWKKFLPTRRLPKRKRARAREVKPGTVIATAKQREHRALQLRRWLAGAHHKWRKNRGRAGAAAASVAGAYLARGRTRQTKVIPSRRITHHRGKRCFRRNGRKYCRKTPIRRTFRRSSRMRRRRF